jgi:sporulation protein YtfJ
MDNQKNTQKSSKLNELVDTALESLHGLVDGNTVLGDPIITPSGTTVIPVSKVSIGIAGGGNDFSKKTEQDGKVNFSGRGGTGLSLIPLAFLVISADGSVELLNIANPTGKAPKPSVDLGSAIETIIDKGPEAITKIKDALAAKKRKTPEKQDLDIVTNEDAESEAEAAVQ